MAPSLPLMAVMMRKEVREILTMEVKKKKTGKLKWALFCLVGLQFYAPVNSYGHAEMVRSPNHTFYLGAS